MYAWEERSTQITMYIKWLISKKLTELCCALFIQSLKFNIQSKPFQTHSQPTFIISQVPMKYKGKKIGTRSVHVGSRKKISELGWLFRSLRRYFKCIFLPF